jgi:type IV fimbrial biogenesis protein FimT
MRSIQTGFSLMELMAGIAVVAIVAGLAAPSFRAFINNSRVGAAQNDLAAALNIARSEAVRRSTTVSVCASSNGTSCDKAPGPVVTAWAPGWLVFRDPGAAGTVAAASDILQKWDAISGGVQLTGTSGVVQFQPTGTIVSPAATVDISYSGCGGKNKRHMQVSLSGSISSQLRLCP